MLANHGFINRNGKNVNMRDLIQALSEVYDVTELFIEGPATGAINLGLTEADPSVDINDPDVIAHQQIDISALGVMLVNDAMQLVFFRFLIKECVHTCEANDAFLLCLSLTDATRFRACYLLAYLTKICIKSFISSKTDITSSTNVESIGAPTCGFTGIVLV
jgi:hypothetical protein